MMKDSLMGCSSCKVFWVERYSEKARSFVEYLQVPSYKTATSLRSTVLVAHPVHVVQIKNFIS